jgi:hypothetical protein
VKTLAKILLILFLLFAIGFSFERYFHFYLDGDIASVVVPSKGFETVMSDPFGMNVLVRDSIYPATNRFFAHWFMKSYFEKAPLLFQSISSPIDSVYLASALAKTLIQFSLIYLLSIYITQRKKIWNIDCLLAATIITPLFQTFGYNEQMGIIDPSITYTFFFALPILWLLLFFLPFHTAFMKRKEPRFGTIHILLLAILAIIISFNGPLNSPLVLIICPVILIIYFADGFLKYDGQSMKARLLHAIKMVPVHVAYPFTIICCLCLYSYYVGLNNLENFWSPLSLTERFSRLPQGFKLQYAEHYGPLVLVAMILTNVVIMKMSASTELRSRIFTLMKWGLFLCIIYVLLLPFGGYREYRPYIVRKDTMLPLSLSIILFYGLTTCYIIMNTRFKIKPIYYGLILLLTGFFIHSDMEIKEANKCERESIEQIALSKDSIVVINNDCWIMTWGKTTDYRNSSLNTELLYRWNVINEKKYYYQK